MQTNEQQQTDVVTDRGEVIRPAAGKSPIWNEVNSIWYVEGFRFIKSRGTFSGNCNLHSFRSFKPAVQP